MAAPIVVALEPELGEQPNASVVAVAPDADLARIVELMQRYERVVAVVTEPSATDRVAAMAEGALEANAELGLASLLAPSTMVHTATVADHADKLRCTAAIRALVEHTAARRHAEPIEQCVDEMVMNALYDAPVGERDRHIFAGLPTATRIKYRTQQSVRVQYACDGRWFAVVVRDAFGSLRRDTVLRFLHKSLHDAQPVDRKASGAGLGMYLMARSATALYFRVLRNVATEAVCGFDLAAPQLVLQELAIVEHAEHVVRTAEPARRIATRATRRRILGRVLAAACAAAALAVGAIAVTRALAPAPPTRLSVSTIPPGASIEIDGRPRNDAEVTRGRAHIVVARLDGHATQQAIVTPRGGLHRIELVLEPIATLDIDSQPGGARVSADGIMLGTTPLSVTSLPPGEPRTLELRHPGYATSITRLHVPLAGQRAHHVQPLTRDARYAPVKFISNPPGAAIVRSDEQVGVDRTYTPAQLFLPIEQEQRFTLVMPKHRPLVIEPFTLRQHDTAIVKGGDLVAE